MLSLSATGAADDGSKPRPDATRKRSMSDIDASDGPPKRPRVLQRTYQPAVPIALETDGRLPTYQRLNREQIEVFEAGPDDVKGSTQARNTP